MERHDLIVDLLAEALMDAVLRGDARVAVTPRPRPDAPQSLQLDTPRVQSNQCRHRRRYAGQPARRR